MSFFNGKVTYSGQTDKQDTDIVCSPTPDISGKLSERPQPWRTLLYDFSQCTTMHGVRFIGTRSRFILRRLFWILVTGCAFGVFMFYLIDRVSFYLSYQKSVNVEVNYIDEAEFPAVTICNQNQFKLSAAVSGGYYEQVRSISQPASSVGSVECQSEELHCDNKCIPMSRMCDGIADCLDQRDEDVDECVSRGCFELDVTGSTTSNDVIDATILDHVFVMDESLEVSGEHVYFSGTNGSQAMTYLMYDGTTQRWCFTHSVEPNSHDVILETADVTTSNALQYIGLWSFSGTNISLEVQCRVPEPAQQDLESLVTSPVYINSLKDMYVDGGHDISDMIQGCSWKGRPCSTSDFEVTDTDLGRCFTYKPNTKIEQSGPGFGLGFTVNIQQYEYTKNTQDGVGLQVLLHAADEPPVMAERSFAVSPGLYSLVTIDRTEVENLHPPWGQCEQRELEYYDTYSVSTCNLDCLNERVREECHCKDIYMPGPKDTGKGDVDYCTLDQYTNCWRPKLDELRLVGNYCSCGTPCREILYVPSLSFSSISSDQDTLQGEELQKMIQMRRNLIQAREVTYRIYPDKYLESIREMTNLIRQAKKTQTRLETVETRVSLERGSVREVMAQVNADCLWLTKEEQKLIDLLNMYLMPLIDNIYQNVHNSVYLYVMELPYRLQEIYDCWDEGSCGYNDCVNKYSCTTVKINTAVLCSSPPCIENTSFKNLYVPVSSPSCSLNSPCVPSETQTWQTMARPLTATLYSSLSILNQTLSNETIAKIRLILQNDTQEFMLHPKYTKPLKPYIRAECDWCFSRNMSVTELLLNVLTEGLLVDVPSLLNDVTGYVDKLHRTYLYEGAFLYPDADREEIDNYLKDMANATEVVLKQIENKIKQPIREVVTMMSELLRLVTPRCGSEMRKLYNEYIDEHNRMENILEDITQFVYNYGEDYRGYQEAYLSNSLDLTDLYTLSDYTLRSTYIQSSNLTLEARFQDRQIRLDRIQQHLDTLYYWFSAQVSKSSLTSGSLFWQRFGIVSPRLESGDNDTDIVGVPMDERYTFTDEVVTQFWMNISDELAESRIHLGIGVTSMLSQITQTQAYMENFASGNEISETFYGKNYLQLEIFYKELTERNVQQLKAYEYAALLGEVGGLMGLLLGASVLTLFEVLDLLIYNSANKCADHMQNRKVVRVNPKIQKMYS